MISRPDPRALALVAFLQFASGVNVVEVYVTATGPEGRPVHGLEASDFRVLEDGLPQDVTVFAAGDFPLSVAVAIDRSWSMAGEWLAIARSAAHTFLGELRPDDRSMLLAIGNGLTPLAPLSTDRGAQHRALQSLEPWGTTSLHDALIEAIDLIQPAGGRRALVLLSDGVDRYSEHSAAEVLSHARGRDVIVYPIAIGRERPELFAELAVLTGGRSFHVRNPRRLGETFSTIAEELRFQYLLGYSPTRPVGDGRGQWRSIRIEVDRPDVRVRARDGYYP